MKEVLIHPADNSYNICVAVFQLGSYSFIFVPKNGFVVSDPISECYDQVDFTMKILEVFPYLLFDIHIGECDRQTLGPNLTNPVRFANLSPEREAGRCYKI